MSTKRVYVLVKYSSTRPRGLENSQTPDTDFQWHHYTQPFLRLLLEVTPGKEAQGSPDSIRLRVVWTPEQDIPSESGSAVQNNIILEDVDLLLVRKHVHPFPMQGLPLKAVYRDSMVGIRYLPIRAQSTAPSEYRRFQMTFQASESAAQFVEAIQIVCPCKSSAISSHASQSVSIRGSQGNEMFLGSQVPFLSQAQIPRTPQSRREMTALPTPQYSADQYPQASRLRVHPYQYQGHFPSSIPNLLPVPSRSASLIDLNHNFILPQSHVTHQSGVHETLVLDRPLSPFALQARPGIPMTDKAMLTMFDPEAQISGVSQPASSLQSGPCVTSTSVPSQGPNGANKDIAGSHTATLVSSDKLLKGKQKSTSTDSDAVANLCEDPILSSLYETCNLDALPPEKLEGLVATIIREEGFVQLLEKLDSLWKLKGLFCL